MAIRRYLRKTSQKSFRQECFPRQESNPSMGVIVVTDKDVLQKMSDCRAGSVKMLKEAACAIVVVGNEDASDVWIEDCSAVMSNMHLMVMHWDLAALGDREDSESRGRKRRRKHLCGIFSDIRKTTSFRRFLRSECRRRKRNLMS